jgi:hypothetical protein
LTEQDQHPPATVRKKRSELTPTDVVRAALQFIELRRYEDVAVLVDPVALQLFRDQRVEEARKEVVHVHEEETEYFHADPAFPIAIEGFFVHDEILADEHSESDPSAMETRLARLQSMTPAQVLGEVLRELDPRDPKATGGEAPRLQRRAVIGEVISGTSAYVLYTSQFADPPAATNLAVLRRARPGWALLPHGELFGQQTMPPPSATAAGPPPFQSLAVRQAPWATRRFDHMMSIDLFPAVLERFRGTPARVAQLLTGVAQEVRTMKPDGRWSIQEHVGHLLDLEELGEARLENFRTRAPVLAAADMSNRKTDQAHHNDTQFSTLLERFQHDREKLVAQLADFSPDMLAHEAQHPRLKRMMTVVEWVYFMCEHDDHHLARMREELADLMAHRPNL